MSQLSLANVINISVAQPGAGAGQYNTSNLGLFTSEQPSAPFASGYKLYISPDEVEDDFGSDSKTFEMANTVFSQTPNILAGDGYLCIMPLVQEVQGVAFSGTPVSGTFVLSYLGNPSAAINWNDTAAQIQAKLRAVAGLESVVVTGSIPAGLVITFYGVYGNIAVLAVSGNSMVDAGAATVTPSVTQSTAGETLAAAITRMKNVIQFFGIICQAIIDQTDALAAAAVVQPLNKILAMVFDQDADFAPAGTIDLLRTGGFTKSRGLFYGGSLTDPLIYLAAYMGRALSTNFEGSNTTQDMHLKELAGVQPDDSIDQTDLTACQAAGADVYVSLEGLPKLFCSGENKFFDQVYNLCWFVGALQVAGFNLLAQTSTKIPQTENGMDQLKDAYGSVCEQARVNQYSAPGQWTSPTTFGNQADLLLNVSQRGYYIYSAPIAQQSQVARAARQAPLCQIALKEAGSINSSDVIINVNA